MSRDCSSCHKDFCDCVREAFRAVRSNNSRRQANSTSKKLEKAGLSFRPAPTANVVIIAKDGKPDVYLSLKPDAGEFKFRVRGKRTWRRMTQKEFLVRM